MFTGIIEATGRVVGTKKTAAGLRLAVALGGVARGVKTGDSIAVNGCCLTVAALQGGRAQFDVVPETLGLTTFGAMGVGDAVNLERASRIGDRLDGHIVQGHVDGVA
ncbi:MAG: riboflavin synthase, partial [Planctomycetota bacterium]